MTKEEFAKIATGIRASYPNQNVLNTTEAVEWWYSLLKDLGYNITAQAVTKWVTTHKFPPAISDIREEASVIALGQIPDWGRGWLEVKNAISIFGYMRPQEALASMSEVTREVVKRMGWQTLCMSDIANEQTDRANFRMIYEELVARKSSDAQTPGYLKELIAKTQSQMMKPLYEKEHDRLMDKENRNDRG